MNPDGRSVVDLFAGPGGLGEGFSAFRRSGGEGAFRIAVSVEKEASAHRTLRFRAFQRLARSEQVPLNLSELNPQLKEGEQELLQQHPDLRDLWDLAGQEAVCAELGGDPAASKGIQEAMDRVSDQCVLIGGPPCQAYSLVGRARNQGIEGYRPEGDPRHFLYKEYVDILTRLNPVAFVMENVKGILSAQVSSRGVFSQIVDDLEGAGGFGYRLFPLAPPTRPNEMELGDNRAWRKPADFVIRSEKHGVPQARHRVIVVGIRKDVCDTIEGQLEPSATIAELLRLEPSRELVPVLAAIGDLSRLRSTLSRRGRPVEDWHAAVASRANEIAAWAEGAAKGDFKTKFVKALKRARSEHQRAGPVRKGKPEWSAELPSDLRQWYEGNGNPRVFNHAARSHIAEDLGRYLFAACFAEAHEDSRSPKAAEFPGFLAPRHANWDTGKFADRFRVQVGSKPATTVTSHISKDGHYFIHPDPGQCRSLTVREAARLQTFPDDYVFFGSRTQQYVQVGNAVPPFLASQIASALDRVLRVAEGRL
jgi:DNA (cytosine-5)-methyltransferase 1